jgi:hypothetical protein
MNIKSHDLEIDITQLVSFFPIIIESISSVAEALNLITSQVQGNHDFPDINSVL